MVKKWFLLVLVLLGFSLQACSPPNEQESDVKGTTPAEVSGEPVDESKLANRD